MKNTELHTILQQHFPACDIEVQGDGYHFTVKLVGEIFNHKSKVVRQQLVYAAVADYIKSGELHALTIQTYTGEEWSTL